MIPSIAVTLSRNPGGCDVVLATTWIANKNDIKLYVGLETQQEDCRPWPQACGNVDFVMVPSNASQPTGQQRARYSRLRTLEPMYSTE
jgi:hypothetical protein